MKLHPLTPSRSELATNIVSILVLSITTLLLFAVMIEVDPPVAWIPFQDRIQDVNLELLSALLTEYAENTFRPFDFLGSLARLVDLPGQFIADLQTVGVFWPLGVRLSAALLVGSVIAFETKRVLLADKLAEPRVAHIKGQRLVAGKTARQCLAANWSRRVCSRDPGIELVEGVSIPRQLEAEHTLLIGGTGAGKTTVMETLMDGAVARQDRVLTFDVKGEVTARFPTDDFVLLALGDRRSSSWLPGLDIVSPEDAAELAAEVIRETSDPSWSGGARQILTALIVYLEGRARQNGKVWTWRQLDRLLAKPVEELFALLKEHDPSSASLIDVEQEETRRQAMSFYFVLIANAARMTRAFALMGGASGKGVSIRQWASGKGCSNLILKQSRRQPELSASLCRIVLKIVADQAGTVSEGLAKDRSATWLFLDEFPQLEHTPAVQRLAAIGRSLGIRIVAAIQSPPNCGRSTDRTAPNISSIT
ncbi:MAG: type IV secretion system DNA-binding domain-containing protein [Roseibium sp.]|uniref:type IV secretion system DNA-binding domain-containing protein n=1 Tax=Roseibium sp. TaxID=1936156 RepID=UPI00329758D8